LRNYLVVFIFDLDPGKPPVDVMLPIVAVVAASATLQASGGTRSEATQLPEPVKPVPRKDFACTPFHGGLYVLCHQLSLGSTSVALCFIFSARAPWCSSRQRLRATLPAATAVRASRFDERFGCAMTAERDD
jgi:hypothetical protein